jgi:hypothetical protein
MQQPRRDFLKLTTAGAAGLVLTGSRRAHAAWPSSGKLDINPAISNMRVVACVDTAMMKSTPTSMAFATQNAAVDYARVQANMDNMAMTLADKTTADEAWKTIFRSGKDWASTVVAIKVNAGEAQNTARLAVLQKFSNLFVGWGVKPENFILYDGHSPATSIFSSSFSTTDKSKVLGVVSAPSGQSGDLLGGWKDAQLFGGGSRRCAAKIADGTVDILIDIANNKGHTMFGKVTLCMKNHYGTWEPDAQHTDLNNLIFNMNKSDAIIGGNPPRQQLCMVDSMFCNKANIFGTPELMPCYLIMGTFAPAVDYLTVKKLREAVSGLTHDSATVNSYVTSWGYTTSDPQWVLVPPATTSNADAGAGGAGGKGTGGAGGGTTGAKGTGGAGGGGSNGAGGTSGSGTTGAGGVGSGGSGSGGSSASGGSGSGGSKASGGSGSGGSKASGGTNSSGGSGSGGTSASGGLVAGGGAGSGGSGSGGSGGALGNGGSAGSGGSGGGGGAQASSTPASGGSGGAAASGGAPGTFKASDNSGCSCHVGSVHRTTSGVGILLAFGALIGGQLRRLFLRRERLGQPMPEKAASASEAEATRQGE